MQPRWLPAMRAGIGISVLVLASAALALAWPWGDREYLLAAVWIVYGAFLIWASRRERSGTRLEPDAIVVTSGRRVDRLGHDDILDLRTDRPGEQAWRVQAVLRDGRLLTLLGVPPAELERLRRWHIGGAPRQDNSRQPPYGA